MSGCAPVDLSFSHIFGELIAVDDLRTLIANCVILNQRVQELAHSDDAALVAATSRKASGLVELVLQSIQSLHRQEADAGAIQSKVSQLSSRLFEEGDEEDSEPDEGAEDAGAVGFHGSNATIPIPDLLTFLQAQQVSGCLDIELENENVTIELERGALAQAFSSNSPKGQRLGEILVSQGAIDEPALREFLRANRNSPDQFGRALEREELVTKDQLMQAVVFQVQQLFNRLFRSEDAKYSFHGGKKCLSGSGLFLSVTQLLLESSRQSDESSRDAKSALTTGS